MLEVTPKADRMSQAPPVPNARSDSGAGVPSSLGALRRRPAVRRTLVALAVLIPALASLLAWRQEPRQDWRVASSWWQPSWWLYPHDVNGFQRLPAFTRVVNDITGVPGSGRLWVVGNGGPFSP